MKAWIGVVAKDHVAVALADGFAMFAHGRHDAALRVKPGDLVAYYSPRTGMRDGAEVRAFTAVGTVLPAEPEQRAMMAQTTGWSRRVAWAPARDAGIYPLLDRLSFVHDRAHWGMYFRKSLFSITLDDFALIADAMGASEAFPDLPARKEPS